MLGVAAVPGAAAQGGNPPAPLFCGVPPGVQVVVDANGEPIAPVAGAPDPIATIAGLAAALGGRVTVRAALVAAGLSPVGLVGALRGDRFWRILPHMRVSPGHWSHRRAPPRRASNNSSA